MNFFLDYTGWVLLFLTTGFILVYKWWRKDKNALTSKYIEERHYRVAFLDMLEAVNAALVNSGFKDVNVHPRNGVFTAKTGFSMSSWMEFIEVRCEQNAGEIVVNFLSICGLPTQLYAWGKNKRNAEKFFRELDKMLLNLDNSLKAA